MIIGYAVVHTDGSSLAAGLPVGPTLADGEALLKVFKLQFPNLGKTAELVELHSLETFKSQLVESLRIEEVQGE